MTNTNKTLIAALLDRSGSMESCKEATQDGFNELINDQKNQPGECLMTLAQFDTNGGFWHNDSIAAQQIPEWVYTNKLIAEVPKLILEPRGGTPLLDAIGNFVTQIGKDLAALPEKDRPDKVILLIMTDGYENTSKTWKRSQIKELITQQETVYNWKFVFLGANMDAIAEGGSLGMSAMSSATYDSHSYLGTRNAYAAASANFSGLRSGAVADVAFTEEQRLSMVQTKDEEDVD